MFVHSARRKCLSMMRSSRILSPGWLKTVVSFPKDCCWTRTVGYVCPHRADVTCCDLAAKLPGVIRSFATGDPAKLSELAVSLSLVVDRAGVVATSYILLTKHRGAGTAGIAEATVLVLELAPLQESVAGQQPGAKL